MADYVLIDGDKAIFEPTFGAATVVVQPGSIRASGPGKVKGKQVCVAGDESSVSVAGCSYVTSSHPISGTGTLEIASLAGDQKAKKTKSGSKLVLLVGSRFTASFTVQSPAQQPTSAGLVADPMPRYSGGGSFKTTNTKFKGV